jgi:hypothetical protein
MAKGRGEVQRGVGMKIIFSVTQLPPDPLFMFSVKDKTEAEKTATEYQSAWLYKEKLLFVLNSEHEQKEKSS